MRERDLLRQLPYFPAPIEELQCEAETQVTLKRANRVVAALRRLCSGSFTELVHRVPRRGGFSQWKLRRPLQDCILRDAWTRLRARACWGTINDGKAVLDRLGHGKKSGYAQMGEVKSGKYERGELCPCVAREVALPKPGSRTVKIAETSSTCKPFLQDVGRRMLRPDGEVD